MYSNKVHPILTFTQCFMVSLYLQIEDCRHFSLMELICFHGHSKQTSTSTARTVKRTNSVATMRQPARESARCRAFCSKTRPSIAPVYTWRNQSST